MAGTTVVTLPGDGIGRTVLPESLRVLEAVGFDAEYVHGDIGWEYWVHEGNPLPSRTVDLLERHRLGLFGAVTSKPNSRAAAELSPALRGTAPEYFSPIVGLRQRFGLDVCIRPCRTFPGNPLNFVRRGRGGDLIEPVVDAVILRQNTEGEYTGVEWIDPPAVIRQALETHRRFAPFREVPGRDLAVGTRIVTRAACRRILRAGFDHARNHGYGSVTICEKSNVLRETSGMMEEEGFRVQHDYPEIRLESVSVDALAMWLTQSPERYGVIVAGNLFGDIVSDGFAGLVGGLGFAASGNIGADVAVFEPTHGSAPKYAALDPPIVNPVAMILAAAMLLEHVGRADAAARIRRAIGRVVLEGRVRTYDMLRIPGGPDVLAAGAASTPQMTDAIIDALE